MVKIFKKKGSQLKGFKDEQGNIIAEPFATDFGNDGITYYQHYKIGGITDYHMGYANQETGEVLTGTFAHMIQGVFAYVRDKEEYKIPNSRFIYLMNPLTGDVLDSDFADNIFPSVSNNNFGSPLNNISLIDHRLSDNLSNNLLLRFKKDNLIGLCDRNGNVIVEPFADNILSDGIYSVGSDTGVINMTTGNIEAHFDGFNGPEIYQPNLDAGQSDYIVKIDNQMFILNEFEYDSNYLDIMLELLKYQR